MNAKFDLGVKNEPIIVLEPEQGVEAILMQAFLCFDANILTVRVQRSENGVGQIKRVQIFAHQGDS